MSFYIISYLYITQYAYLSRYLWDSKQERIQPFLMSFYISCYLYTQYTFLSRYLWHSKQRFNWNGWTCYISKEYSPSWCLSISLAIFILNIPISRNLWDSKQRLNWNGWPCNVRKEHSPPWCLSVYLAIFILNMPFYVGTCEIVNKGLTEMDDPVTSGKNTALLDVYYISCQGWMDPNRHNIIKYVFKGNYQIWSFENNKDSKAYICTYSYSWLGFLITIKWFSKKLEDWAQKSGYCVVNMYIYIFLKSTE